MSVYRLKTTQRIPSSQDAVWDFISSPANLQKITPPYMGFQITTPDLPVKAYPGMIISYKVSPVAGIKMTWVTEITQVKEPDFFVDEQRSGPYNLWHHEHHLRPIEGGVLMTDIVHYKPPFRILGDLAQWLFIRKQLKGIFAYRNCALEKIFGSFPE